MIEIGGPVRLISVDGEEWKGTVAHIVESLGGDDNFISLTVAYSQFEDRPMLATCVPHASQSGSYPSQYYWKGMYE